MRRWALLALILALFTAPSLGAEPPSRQRDYEAAAKLYRQRSYHAAALAFEAGWHRHQDGPFLFNAAAAYEKAKRPVQALQMLELFASRFPDEAERAQTTITRLAGTVQKTHGRLEVRAEPKEATVRLAGERLTTARWLPKGQFEVTVEHPGYQPVRRSVTLGAGERLVVTVTLQPLQRPVGSLIVHTEPPGCEIRLDGEFRGRAPVRIDDVDPGEHRVLARTGVAQVEELVRIEGGRTSTLTLKLVAPAGPDKPPVRPTISTPITQRWWFWTLIGVGVAGATTAVILATLPGDETIREPAAPADWGVWGGR